MANDARRDAESVFKAENEVDLLLGGANPNPTREGCPPREKLIALARRQVPVGDPVGEHVSKCSPCYREMRAIQQAEGIRPADERWASRSWWPTAAAAVLVVAAGLAAWFAYGNRQPAPKPAPEQIVAEAEPVTVTLDLRRYGVTRSDAPAEDLPPLLLPRAKMTLTLLLPTGSELGDYEVRIVNTEGQVTATSQAQARILDFIARLEVGVDARPLRTGAYRLELQRSGEGVQVFSLTVKQ